MASYLWLRFLYFKNKALLWHIVNINENDCPLNFWNPSHFLQLRKPRFQQSFLTYFVTDFIKQFKTATIQLQVKDSAILQLKLYNFFFQVGLAFLKASESVKEDMLVLIN